MSREPQRPAEASFTGAPRAFRVAQMTLVLLGPPGVGKGTQAVALRDEFELDHVSTGDLLRDHARRATDLGRRASEFMSSGRLVPDELVVSMVEERIDASPRLLLDGFPRTLGQAHALAYTLTLAGRSVTAAIHLEAADDVVIERIGGRRHCPRGHVYHLRHHPPRREGVCDFDGEPLEQRDDDRVETVRRRLDVFRRTAAPLVAYYERLGLLRRLDCSLPIDVVQDNARRLLSALDDPGRS